MNDKKHQKGGRCYSCSLFELYSHKEKKGLWYMMNRELFALPGERFMIEQGGKLGKNK